jgi:hypothetical protein
VSPDVAAWASLVFEFALIFALPLAFAVRELVLLRREDRLRARGVTPPEPAWYRIAIAQQRRLAERRRREPGIEDGVGTGPALGVGDRQTAAERTEP